jgi:hypothetical protein
MRDEEQVSCRVNALKAKLVEKLREAWLKRIWRSPGLQALR